MHYISLDKYLVFNQALVQHLWEAHQECKSGYPLWSLKWILDNSMNFHGLYVPSDWLSLLLVLGLFPRIWNASSLAFSGVPRNFSHWGCNIRSDFLMDTCLCLYKPWVSYINQLICRILWIFDNFSIYDFPVHKVSLLLHFLFWASEFFGWGRVHLFSCFGVACEFYFY